MKTYQITVKFKAGSQDAAEAMRSAIEEYATDSETWLEVSEISVSEPE